MGQRLTAFEKRIEIRWSDLDSSRHVNNSVYLAYLEEVRTAWLARALQDVDLHDFVLARIAIDFKRELTLDDEIAVARCTLAGLGTSSIRTTEVIATQGGEVAAEAEAVVVARDSETGRSRPLTAGERSALTDE
ncbi:MAG: acyl-CoA thioesterase [Gaiellaceae bacterium]